MAIRHSQHAVAIPPRREDAAPRPWRWASLWEPVRVLLALPIRVAPAVAPLAPAPAHRPTPAPRVGVGRQVAYEEVLQPRLDRTPLATGECRLLPLPEVPAALLREAPRPAAALSSCHAVAVEEQPAAPLATQEHHLVQPDHPPQGRPAASLAASLAAPALALR